MSHSHTAGTFGSVGNAGIRNMNKHPKEMKPLFDCRGIPKNTEVEFLASGKRVITKKGVKNGLSMGNRKTNRTKKHNTNTGAGKLNGIPENSLNPKYSSDPFGFGLRSE